MKKLTWLLLLVATSMWAQNTNYNPGTTAIILSAVTTTGTGTCYAMLNQGAIPANFTWQTVIAGGTASSDHRGVRGIARTATAPTRQPSTPPTSTSGDVGALRNKAYPYVTANITAYSRNRTTATVNFVAQYGSGVPTPSAGQSVLRVARGVSGVVDVGGVLGGGEGRSAVPSLQGILSPEERSRQREQWAGTVHLAHVGSAG